MSVAMEAIEEYYGNTKASRTGIPYINHIREGCQILRLLGASVNVIDAFALHPIFQMEEHPEEHPAILHRLRLINAEVVFWAREYKKTANAYLCKPHYTSADDHIELSKHASVNLMLVADKIQNRKDFEQAYEPQADKTVFARSENLAQYFRNWLRALGVSEEKYQQTVCELTTGTGLTVKSLFGRNGREIPRGIREIARLAIKEYGDSGMLYLTLVQDSVGSLKVRDLKLRNDGILNTAMHDFVGLVDQLLAKQTPESLDLIASGVNGEVVYRTLINLPFHTGQNALAA